MSADAIRCLVTGASGYVGGRLVPLLLDRGVTAVRALARNPDKLADVPWRDRVEVARGDLGDPDSLSEAFDGVDVVYYLVHSMGTESDFVAAEARSARNVVAAAQRAGVKRLVYLGGLHPSGADLSPHLRSRVAVGEILLDSGIETIVLQAGIVIGSGSASFEMMRHLTNRLPAMTTPKWVHNRIQPIADRRRAALSGRGGHRRRACVTHLGRRRPGCDGVRRRDAGVRRRGRPASAADHRDSVPDTDDREPVDRPRHAHAAGSRAPADRVTGMRCGAKRTRHRHRHRSACRWPAPDIAMPSRRRCSAARCPSDPHWAHVGRTTRN